MATTAPPSLAPCGIPYILYITAPPSLAPCGIRPPWMVEVRKMQEQFSADPHGKDCSYNPVAFPPSMEVRSGKCGKCICPWMDGSRAMQEQLPRSNFQSVHPVHNRTAIPGSLRNTTHMDVGSAENAGAIFSPYILYIKGLTHKTMCEAFISLAVVLQQICSQNKFRSLVRPWHKNLACYYTL